MKKFSGFVSVVVVTVFVSSLAFAAEIKVGTVKSIDRKAGTIVLISDGGDVKLAIDKSADMSAVKAGDKVEVSVENNTVKQAKPAVAAKPKAAVGC